MEVFSPTHIQVQEILNTLIDAYLHAPLFNGAHALNIQINLQGILIEATLAYPVDIKFSNIVKKTMLDAIHAKFPKTTCIINLTSKINAYKSNNGIKPIQNIKNIIAVGSGKGGVGKSTIALNLALGLQAQGAKVGLLDADIYGPSQPSMLGGKLNKAAKKNNTLQPAIHYGLQNMSIGYLIENNSPIVWRGPMISRAVEQLLQETTWHNLDYLIVDLPPGTGDIQLTLAQKIPLNGVVIVTTPQEVAKIDAAKAIEMFTKLNIPILGIVENMNHHVCSHCGHQDLIFGAGGAQQLSLEYKVPVLQTFNIERTLQEHSDKGTPLMIEEPNHNIAEQFYDLARFVGARLSKQEIEYRAGIPPIVMR